MRERVRTAIWLTLSAISIAAMAALLVWPGDDGSPSHDSAAMPSHGEFGPTELLRLPFAQIEAVDILFGGKLARFERDGKGNWYYHGHVHGNARDASGTHAVDTSRSDQIERALAMFGRIKSDRKITDDPGAGGAYGIDRPKLIVMAVKDKAKAPVLSLHFGAATPDGLGRYVLVAQSRAIVVVPAFQAENLRKLFFGFVKPAL